MIVRSTVRAMVSDDELENPMSHRHILAIGLTLVLACTTAFAEPPNCSRWNTPEFFRAATVADVDRCLEQGQDLKVQDPSGHAPLPVQQIVDPFIRSPMAGAVRTSSGAA